MYVDVAASRDPGAQVEPELPRRLRERLAAGDNDGAGALVPDRLLSRFAFAGTPSEVAQQTLSLFEAGRSGSTSVSPYLWTASARAWSS